MHVVGGASHPGWRAAPARVCRLRCEDRSQPPLLGRTRSRATARLRRPDLQVRGTPNRQVAGLQRLAIERIRWPPNHICCWCHGWYREALAAGIAAPRRSENPLLTRPPDESGRSDLNRRPFGAQPSDRVRLCVQERPHLPHRPRSSTAWTYWTMQSVPPRYHTAVPDCRGDEVSGPVLEERRPDRAPTPRDRAGHAHSRMGLCRCSSTAYWSASKIEISTIASPRTR
jgi:hypothetical protein